MLKVLYLRLELPSDKGEEVVSRLTTEAITKKKESAMNLKMDPLCFQQVDLTKKFKCIEKRYSLAFFIRWFDKNTSWLVNFTMDGMYLVLYKINDFIGLVDSG